MSLHRTVFVLLLLGFIATDVAYAQRVTFHGQVRPRYEYRHFGDDAHDEFVSMRVRAGLEAGLADDVSVFLQLQDVRLWGEEFSPLGDFNADAFDLHQGYLVIDRLADEPLAARIGRQEISLGEERLMGAVDWTPQGQAFDGVRMRFTPRDLDADLLVLRTGEESAGEEDGWVLGAYTAFDLDDAGTLDVYGFLERVRDNFETDEFTVGGRWAIEHGRAHARIEAAAQLGERFSNDVSAYLVALAAGLELSDDVRLTLWYDYLSGDADPDDDETNVFRTLYATNHRFYGYADVFLDIPSHTAGHGLQDAAVKLAYSPSQRTSVELDVHTFRVAERGTLEDAHLGDEIDFTVRHRLRDPLGVTAGLSYVWQDDALAEIGRLEDDLFFGYLMLNVVF